MQTAYVVPQHVSERYAKLLVGCQQQLQLQTLSATCHPTEGHLRASFSKLQLYSLQEQSQQLGSSDQLSTRRSDLMDVQIRDILTGLRPSGSMPARTSSGQQAMHAGIRKNKAFSIGTFSLTGTASGLASGTAQPSAAQPAEHAPMDVHASVEDVALRFEPDDAFAACAALRDIKAASQLLSSAHHAVEDQRASQGHMPQEAQRQESSPQPARPAATHKQAALLRHMQTARLHISLGPLRAEAALAAGFHWQAEVSLLDVQAGGGIKGSLKKGSILLNERPLISCASAVADLVHPVPFKPQGHGERTFLSRALLFSSTCRVTSCLQPVHI